MELLVDSRELKEWLFLLDKLVGTVEPSARFVDFFFRDGLWLRASDNCASVEVFLGKIPRFEGSRRVSLDLLKFFLSDVKVKEVHVTISQDHLVLKAGNEVLDVRCRVGGVLPKTEKRSFSALFQNVSSKVPSILRVRIWMRGSFWFSFSRKKMCSCSAHLRR